MIRLSLLFRKTTFNFSSLLHNNVKRTHKRGRFKFEIWLLSCVWHIYKYPYDIAKVTNIECIEICFVLIVFLKNLSKHYLYRKLNFDSANIWLKNVKYLVSNFNWAKVTNRSDSFKFENMMRTLAHLCQVFPADKLDWYKSFLSGCILETNLIRLCVIVLYF